VKRRKFAAFPLWNGSNGWLVADRKGPTGWLGTFVSQEKIKRK